MGDNVKLAEGEIQVESVTKSSTMVKVLFQYPVAGYDSPLAGTLTYYLAEGGFTLHANFFTAEQLEGLADLAADIKDNRPVGVGEIFGG